MHRIIYAAMLLFVVQIGLVVTMNMNDQSLDAFVANTNLLDFDADSVDLVIITDSKGQQLEIKKQQASWLLPSKFSAPADKKQVEDFLDVLADLKQGMAVATTKEAAARFKVADIDFQHRIVVKQGEKVVVDLYTGSSPGFRQLHVRVSGHDEVVTVELSDYEFEPVVSNWINKNLVQVSQEKISNVKMADFILKRHDDQLLIQGLHEDEDTVVEQVDILLKKISGLTIQTVVDPAEVAALFEEEPFLEFSLSYVDGNKEDFVFVKQQGEEYILKTSEHDFFFKVENWMVDAIKKVTRKDLVRNKKIEKSQAHDEK